MSFFSIDSPFGILMPSKYENASYVLPTLITDPNIRDHFSIIVLIYKKKNKTKNKQETKQKLL